MAGAAATTSSSYSRGTTSPRFSSPPPPPPAAAGRNDLGVAGSEMGGSASTVAGAMGIAGLGGSGSEDYTGAAGGGDGGSTEQEVDLDLPEKLDKVATFVAITQQARSMAFQFLRATDWRLDAAINLFMESGGDTGAGAAAGSKLAAGARGGGGVRESVSARANDVATARSTFSADEVSGTPGGLGGPGVRGAGVARRYGGDGDNEYEVRGGNGIRGVFSFVIGDVDAFDFSHGHGVWRTENEGTFVLRTISKKREKTAPRTRGSTDFFFRYVVVRLPLAATVI